MEEDLLCVQGACLRHAKRAHLTKWLELLEYSIKLNREFSPSSTRRLLEAINERES